MEALLNEVHKRLGRAEYPLVMMIVRRRASRAALLALASELEAVARLIRGRVG